MKNCNIYYYHPLDLSFKSAQTLQIIKDYSYLSKLGYRIFLFGNYSDAEELREIEEYSAESNLSILSHPFGAMGRLLTKLSFLKKIFLDSEPKIIVTRHHKKLAEIMALKFLFTKPLFFHEMHEESFPYLLRKSISKPRANKLFRQVDNIIFTNYSQKTFFQQEFKTLPQNHVVLPNGVEIEKFKDVTSQKNFVLTYAGQFNRWKNIELIFSALALLDNKYSLRIAGGKNTEASIQYIESLRKKYNISADRIHFLGFVKNQHIADQVLNKSHALLLPLGDNIQSKYLTSPMKLFEYMATKVPVVSINYPSINLIADDKILFLSTNNAEDFSKKIQDACNALSTNGRIAEMNKLASQYSYQNRSLRYKAVIERFLNDTSPSE